MLGSRPVAPQYYCQLPMVILPLLMLPATTQVLALWPHLQQLQWHGPEPAWLPSEHPFCACRGVVTLTARTRSLLNCALSVQRMQSPRSLRVVLVRQLVTSEHLVVLFVFVV